MKFQILRILIFLVSVYSFAQKKHTEHTLRLEHIDNQQKIGIEKIEWLAGSWFGEGMGGVAREIWSKPKAKVMIGMFQMNKNNKVVFYEFCQIVEKNGSLILRIKHFSPDFIGWEEKDKTVDFPLIRIEDQTAWFDGLTFKREESILTAWVAIRQNDGKIKEGAFNFNLTNK